MIILIILVLMLLYIFNKHRENFTNSMNTSMNNSMNNSMNTSMNNSMNTSMNTNIFSCGKNVVVKDSISDYINKLNNSTINKRFLQPNDFLPYNLNNTDQYNILNNYGIKNSKKRNDYINTLNNNTTIPYNSIKLLKNYDKELTNAFTTINIGTSNHNRCNDNNENNNANGSNLPEIYVVSKDNNIQWSYNSIELEGVGTHFYIYFDFVTKCDDPINFNKFRSLKISSNFKSEFFKLVINKSNNTHIYKLEYTNTNKFARLFVVLKRNNIIIKKSNNITTN